MSAAHFKSCLKLRPLALPCSWGFFCYRCVTCRQICWLPLTSVGLGVDTEGPRAVGGPGTPASGQNASLSLLGSRETPEAATQTRYCIFNRGLRREDGI